MIENTSEPHKKKTGLSRRNFLRMGAATGAAIAVNAAGTFGAGDLASQVVNKVTEIISSSDKENAEKKLEDLFGKEAVIDIFTDVRHAISMATNPEKTLLFGEFAHDRINQIDVFSGDDEYLNSNSENIRFLAGVSRIENGKYSQYAVIACTDGNMNFNNIADFIEASRSNTQLRAELIKQAINTVEGGGAALVGAYPLNDLLFNREFGTDSEGLSRRKFLKGGALLTGTFVAGGATRIVSEWAKAVTMNSSQFDLNLEKAEPFEQDVYKVFAKFGEFITPLRNLVMDINVKAISVLNLEDVDTVQDAFANGHLERLSLVNEKTRINEEKIFEVIFHVISAQIDVLKKYIGTPDYPKALIALITSLQDFYEFFHPVTLRVNANKNVSLQEVQNSQKTSDAKSAFLCLCEAIKTTMYEISQNKFSDDYFINQQIWLALKLSFSELSYEDKQYKKNDDLGFESGFAGNSLKPDSVIELFGKKYFFSNGLLASIER